MCVAMPVMRREEGGGRRQEGGKFYCEKGDLVRVGVEFPVAMEID